MIGSALSTRVEAALGQPVLSAARVPGGDINDAFELVLVDQRKVFLKTHAQAPAALFAAEAEGLEFLRAAQALRIPQVLAVSPAGEGPPFLLLEFIAPSRRRRDFDETLGRGLALLHRFGAPSFGFRADNFIGRLPQANRSRESWAEFYHEQRLEPQLRAARATGRASLPLCRRFEQLFEKMPALVGDSEPPARLHGDLWSGNVHLDEQGAPCLIDPAVYGGHREMDLAMMRLFGGFSERVFAAYAEVNPLARGHEERVPLYQLYPLLVHLNLFGGSYLASVEQALSRYL